MFVCRSVVLAAFFVFLVLSSAAQSPDRINYQAVARNTQTGTELVNQDILLSAQVRQGGPNGTIIYQESHATVNTDDFGLFSIQVGGGNVVTGNFTQIPWEAGNFWLQVDIDAGQGLQNAGAMQLLSVPYALHANTASNVDDADSDPTNELVQDLIFDPGTRQITLVQEGEDIITDLGTVVVGLTLNPETYVLNLEQQGPVNQEVNLAPLREGLDQSDQNELINPGWPILLPGNILQIREADIDHEVDLSPLVSPVFWELNASETGIFSTVSRVGIGTEEPMAKLEVRGAESRLVEVGDNENNTLFTVQNSGVGIGGGVGSSKIQMTGSVAYDYVLINNQEITNYSVQPMDNVVVAFMEFSFPFLTLSMPDAVAFPGRVITIKKIGAAGSVSINFSNTLDLSIQNDAMSGALPQTRSYMSIGEDGWITLYRE